MTFDELSEVSDKLVSLTCNGGLLINHNQVEMHLMRFPRLEEVVIRGMDESDLKFIISILEDSIPTSDRRFLKNLDLDLSQSIFSLSSIDCQKLSSSLIKVIEVRVWFF
jgi:hypothetical protein